MQPHDPTPTSGARPPAKNNTARYAATLAALILIVGGLAWVIQYLPGRAKPVVPAPVNKKLEKPFLAFERGPVAVWGDPIITKDKEGQETRTLPFKDVEFGDKGHYDFLFTNKSERDIEVLAFRSSCDCNSMKVTVVSADQWAKLNQQQTSKPGEPLTYAAEPSWSEIPKVTPKVMDEAPPKPCLVIKADEVGVMRVQYAATKIGSESVPNPTVAVRRAGDHAIFGQSLTVPIVVRPALQFHPQRVHVGVLTSGKSIKADFDVWSATRPKLDLAITTLGNDPLFSFKITELSGDEFKAKREELLAKMIAPRVLSAYRVTVTVHESKDGRFLDQGSFYRKPYFTIDGKADPENPMWGPEIVGRVEGDIEIGGADDFKKVVFKPFQLKDGATKEVFLVSSADLDLKTLADHPNQPPWIKVDLARAEKQPSKTRTTWILEVTVPPNAVGARTFEEPDAVVLRIAGAKDRFVRIPLEGHISR